MGPIAGMQSVFVFLSVGAVALFSFITIVSWSDARRKEREAYYRHESLRRLGEMPGDGARQVVAFMREEDLRKQRNKREGMKLGGVINIGVGVALCIFLYMLAGPASPWACGLFPGLIGAGMLVYVYLLAPAAE